ncbi:N-acetylmuramoyl-L-alanine amidase [Stagnimonas aquatica]|nr:N-acetylmuramoyl-L-alanine amidase [Stagnimonas aquatica]
MAMVLGLLASLAHANELRDLRLWDGPESTRVVFDLESQTSHKSFTLENPSRLVIDIADAKLAGSVQLDGLSKGLVKSVRTGPRDGGLRVVLDLAETASPKSFGLEPNGQYGYRLIFDLYGSQASAPAMPALPESSESVIAAAPAAPVVSAPSPATVAVAPSPRPSLRVDAAPAARPAPMPGQKPIIVAIDAGHGGEDPGARGRNGVIEKEVCLRIARKLARMVNETPGYKAVLTRNGDYYVGLRERTAIARKAQADLFVSIHANSLPVAKNVRGSAVYVLSQRGATSEHAKMLASLENAADLVGGVGIAGKDDDLASVLLDISQTAVREASFDFGSRLLESIGQFNPLQKAEVQQAGFAVLKAPDIPSVLVETAFLSHPEDERLLAASDYQDSMAASLLAGIKGYFSGYRPQQQVVQSEPGPVPVSLRRKKPR